MRVVVTKFDDRMTLRDTSRLAIEKIVGDGVILNEQARLDTFTRKCLFATLKKTGTILRALHKHVSVCLCFELRISSLKAFYALLI